VCTVDQARTVHRRVPVDVLAPVLIDFFAR
jgi:hypothetical protein